MVIKRDLNHTLSKDIDSVVQHLIKKELERQKGQIQLIASENFTSQEVIKTMGSVLTNKYAEGYPQKRYYAGCEVYDELETLAIERAKKLFDSSYANVQPHSGVNANLAVQLATLKPYDKILSMNLADGGHLSHGHPHNLSGKFFEIHNYSVDKETEMLDYDAILDIAKKVRPQLIIAGASSYPRIIDFSRFREIADEVGAKLMADIAHTVGLVVAGFHPTPVDVAHFTTATTHKTLRGPRGGLIISSSEYGSMLDEAIFPGVQGGPLMHIIGAKAVAFREAARPSFKSYIKRVVENCSTLCEFMKEEGFRIVSGGTDNHLFLIDLTNMGMTGFEATGILSSIGITLNKNVIPNERLSPVQTSGIRIGTAAVSTQGMGTEEMYEIGNIISGALKNRDNEKILGELAKRVKILVSEYPVYTNFYD